MCETAERRVPRNKKHLELRSWKRRRRDSDHFNAIINTEASWRRISGEVWLALTCRGRPVCVGLWAEVREEPQLPSNYTAVYSVWWCLLAVAVASTKHLHTGYLNPSSLGPTHL